MDDRAAGREVVGGRAGRRGEDEAVAEVVGDQLAVGEAPRGGPGCVLSRSLMRMSFRARLGRPLADRAGQHRAVVHLEGPRQQVGEFQARLVGREDGEEPEASPVDPDDGNLRPGRPRGRRRGGCRRRRSRSRRRSPSGIRRAAGSGRLLQPNAPFPREAHELARKAHGAGLSGVDDEREGTDGLHGGGRRRTAIPVNLPTICGGTTGIPGSRPRPRWGSPSCRRCGPPGAGPARRRCTEASAASCTAASRITPRPLSASALPASNWGFTRATRTPPGAQERPHGGKHRA